jgi:phosphoglycerol transferase MdoB-like AlkP superfamily enzyme
MSNNMKNSLILYGIISFTFIYYEIIFRVRVLVLNYDSSLFRAILFALAYSVIILFLVKFFKAKTVTYLFYTIFGLVLFIYFNQEIYESWFGGFFSVTAMGAGKEGLAFIGDYFESFRIGQIFYFIPLGLIITAHKLKWLSFEVEYNGLKQPLFLIALFSSLFAISVSTISQNVEAEINSDVAYTDRDLYVHIYSNQAAVKKFGILTYTYRDIMSLFITDPLNENEYEILLEDYLAHRPFHENNTYKGLLEDKNFILIMAESLDTYAINEELTPNLWHLKNNYAYFDNYYSPLHYRSTADTEFMVQTSIYPDKNVTLSMDEYIDNTFPYTLPRMFKQQGYSTFSFHNYTDYFYPRTRFHEETLGYDAYYGSEELGMLANPPEGAIINNHPWQSDLTLMEKAVPYFIDENKFFVNMLTVSGHFRYSGDHEIAKLHEQEILDYEADHGIELDNEIFWYLAANIELDLAIGHLLDELVSHNKMDDTVIMIFGDHYAYGVDEDAIWEYDDIKEDGDEMDLHNVPLILVSDHYLLDEPIETYMSSIDVIPTVANLFDLNLDYQKVFGTDVFSAQEHIVRFADMSFVSKDFKYESLSEQFEIYNEAVVPEYLLEINYQLLNDYRYNLLLLQYDYFKEDEEPND